MTRDPKIIATREEPLNIDDRTYTVEIESWDTASPTFHVYDDAGNCLTQKGAFEEFPTPDDVRSLICATCKFCGQSAPVEHYHQSEPVCPDCWDDRLYSTQ